MNYMGQGNGYWQGGEAQVIPQRKKRINFSMIFGIISTLLIIVGLFLRFATYSHSGHTVFDYNFFEFCDRASYIEIMWRGLPYGIVIAGILMLIFSFIKLPFLKLFPCLLLIAVFILLGYNAWDTGESVMEYLTETSVIVFEGDSDMNIGEYLGAGIFCMAAGLITGIISCFLPAGDSE